MTPRLRHVFEETAYWAPSLETTASGRTAFNFTLARQSDDLEAARCRLDP